MQAVLQQVLDFIFAFTCRHWAPISLPIHTAYALTHVPSDE